MRVRNHFGTIGCSLGSRQSCVRSTRCLSHSRLAVQARPQCLTRARRVQARSRQVSLTPCPRVLRAALSDTLLLPQPPLHQVALPDTLLLPQPPLHQAALPDTLLPDTLQVSSTKRLLLAQIHGQTFSEPPPRVGSRSHRPTRVGSRSHRAGHAGLPSRVAFGGPSAF